MITLQTIFYGVIILIIAYIAGRFGFNLRKKELAKLKRRVGELEEEILYSHREMIHLETELAKRLTATLHGTAPVIPIPKMGHQAAK